MLAAMSPSVAAAQGNKTEETGRKLAERLQQLRPGIPIENVLPIEVPACSPLS